MGLRSSVWKDYKRLLVSDIVAKWRALVDKYIIAALSVIQSHVAADRPGGMKMDSWPDDVSRQFDLLTAEYDALAVQARDAAAAAFGSVNTFSRRQWYETAKRVMGVDLFQFEPWIQAESKAFVAENVGLITKTGTDVLHDVRRVVMTGFREGKRWETLRDEIVGSTELGPGVFDKVETRAEVVARDQCTKLYGDLNEKRQVSAGLDLYIWRTMEDERVVGNPSGRFPRGSAGHRNHYDMDDKVCKWTDSTVYADSVKAALAGEWKKRTEAMPKATPGKEILCRCYGEPVFEAFYQ